MSTAYEIAEDLLGIVEQQALQNGVSLPERKVIYTSPIPADCEQVAVLLSGWQIPGDTGQLMNCIVAPWVATLSVIITRCTPAMPKGNKGAAPPEDAMKAAAEMASTDAELFRDVMAALSPRPFQSPSIVIQSPVGGLQTVELSLSLGE